MAKELGITKKAAFNRFYLLRNYFKALDAKNEGEDEEVNPVKSEDGEESKEMAGIMALEETDV